MYYLSFIYLWSIFFLNKKSNVNKDYLILLPFFLLPFLRFGVGADYFSYQYLYDNLPASNFQNFWNAYPGVEMGFKFLLLAGRKLGLSYHVFIGSLSLLLSLFVYYWAKKNSKNIHLSMIVYFSLFYFVWNLNAIRQGLVLIVFSSLIFSQQPKKLYQEIMIVLVLSLFHASVLVTLPLLILKRINIRPITFIMLIISAVLFSQLPFASLLQPFKSLKYLGKVYKYIDEIGVPFLSFATIARIILYMLVLAFYKITNESNDKFSNEILKFYLLGLSLYFFMKPIETLAARSSIYGYYLIVLIIPLVYDHIQKTNFQILKPTFILFLITFTTMGTYKEMQGAVVQSGYKHGIRELNTVTIFNYDRHDFYNKFNILYSIEDSSQYDFSEFHKNEEMNREEIIEFGEYFIPVSFPNQNPRFGVIDSNGNIIEKPSYHYRPQIFGRFIEEFHGDGVYKEKRFRELGSTDYSDEHEVHQEILDVQELITKYNHFGFQVNSIDYKKVEQTSLKEFVHEEDIKNIKLYSFNYPQKFEIIEVKTQGKSLLMLNKVENISIESKLYYSIEPYRGTDIFYATTEHTQEFINSKGEIIWIEHR